MGNDRLYQSISLESCHARNSNHNVKMCLHPKTTMRISSNIFRYTTPAIVIPDSENIPNTICFIGHKTRLNWDWTLYLQSLYAKPCSSIFRTYVIEYYRTGGVFYRNKTQFLSYKVFHVLIELHNRVAKVCVVGYCMLRQLGFVTFQFQTNSQNGVYRRAIVTGVVFGKLCIFEFLARRKAARNTLAVSSVTVHLPELFP